MDTDTSSRRTAALVAALAAFLTPFMGSAVNVALPVVVREFALDAVSQNWVNLAFLLAAAMFLVPLGRVADMYGRKRIFAWGLSLYALSSLGCAVAPSAAWLIGCRGLQGLAGAMIFGTGVAILTSVFPPGERGKVLGLNVSSTYLGLSLGPVLGGVLTQQLGWRSIFALNVPLCLLAVLLVWWRLKGEWAEGRGDPFDLPGAGVYGLSLVALVYGFSRLPALPGAGLVAAGLGGLAGFVWWETRAASPLLNPGLFRGNPVFAFSNLAALINYSATFAVGFLLSLYLQYIKGLNPQEAGMVLVAQPAVMAVCSPATGWLSDRIEPRILASAGMGLAVLGLALLSLLDSQTSLGFIAFCLVLLGLAFALFSSPNTNAVMGSVERRQYGVASAALGTMRLVGQTLSLGLAMVVFAVYLGKVQIAPAVYPLFLRSTRTAFSLFAILCFGGVFASLARGNLR